MRVSASSVISRAAEVSATAATVLRRSVGACGGGIRECVGRDRRAERAWGAFRLNRMRSREYSKHQRSAGPASGVTRGGSPARGERSLQGLCAFERDPVRPRGGWSAGVRDRQEHCGGRSSRESHVPNPLRVPSRREAGAQRSRRATDRFLRRIVQSRRGEPRRSIRGACVCRTSRHYNSVGRSGRGCTTACDGRNTRVACRVCVCSRVRGRRHRLSPAPGALLSHRRNSVARLRALRRSVRERWRYRCARPPHRPVAAPSAHRTDAACPARPDRLCADRYQLARRTG